MNTLPYVAAICMLVIVQLPLLGQHQRFSDNVGETWIGGGALGAQSSIGNIYDMLVDGNIFNPTPHEERVVNTVGGTIWGRLGAPYSDLFVEGQFSFLSTIKVDDGFEGGHFYLQNDMGLEYKILFDYDQVNFDFSVGWFLPLPDRDQSALGIYVLPLSFTWSVLTGTSIDYKSNEPQFDLAIEEALEQGFNFRNDFLFSPGAGIQCKVNDNLAIEARYTQAWGLVDILETQNNSFFWREQDNRTRTLHQVALTCLVYLNN